MSNSKAALVVPAVKKHTATVIMAHGLGDSGAGWVDLANTWRRSHRFDEVSFIFPNAPTIPITGNMGMSMPGWYDIHSFTDLGLKTTEDNLGMLKSRTTLHNLITAETTKNSIPSHRIVLGGFSQGGAISLLSGLTYAEKLGGVFAMSSYLLLRDRFRDLAKETGDKNRETKVWMGHGEEDPLVRCEWGRMTAEALRGWGFDVEMKTYPRLPHSASPEEIEDLAKFLETRIPPLGDKDSKA
ncbi:MAG: hypothetical protein M1817_003812 [Caeruleum heppii]|nr:MAG: hypothetical protein M1817_003812 [Caeruleum heppii]